MQLKDFIAALQEIQNQHPDEEVYVAIEDHAEDYDYDYCGPKRLEPEEGEISVEKLLISGEPTYFYRPEGRDLGNRKTVVVLGW